MEMGNRSKLPNFGCFRPNMDRFWPPCYDTTLAHLLMNVHFIPYLFSWRLMQCFFFTLNKTNRSLEKSFTKCRAYKIWVEGEWIQTTSKLSQGGQYTLPEIDLLGGGIFYYMIYVSKGGGFQVGFQASRGDFRPWQNVTINIYILLHYSFFCVEL